MKLPTQRKMLATIGGVLAILLLAADYTFLGMAHGFGILQLTAVITLSGIVLYQFRSILKIERIKEEFENFRGDLLEKNTILSSPRMQRNTLLVVGAILTILCLAADYTGLGTSSGIGYKQIVGPICGVGLIGTSLFLLPKIWKKSKRAKAIFALGICLLAAVLLLTAMQRPDIFPLKAMGTLTFALVWSAWILMFSRGIREFFEEPTYERTDEKEQRLVYTLTGTRQPASRCLQCGEPILKQVVICPQCGAYRADSGAAAGHILGEGLPKKGKRSRRSLPPRRR